MKQRIKSFPEFLTDRFQPCILCSFSDSVLSQIPDIMTRITSAWNVILQETHSNVRLIFPKFKVDINMAISDIINMRNTQSNTKPYYFLSQEPVTEKQGELPTMTILRQRLFESDFMPFHLYCDIPISILLFTVGLENPFPSKSYFPQWIQSKISQIKPYIIKLPISDLTSALHTFYNKNFLPKLLQSEKNVIQERQQVKSQTLFSISKDPSNKVIAVKYFADLKMQQKRYEEAISDYHKLFDTPLSQQANFLIILCLIMANKKKRINFAQINQIFPEKNEIELFAIHMMRFYLQRSIPVMKEILPFGKCYIILSSFLYEQYAYLCPPHERAFRLSLAARSFAATNSTEFQVRCLYNAWGLVHPYHFNLIGQKLIESALRVYQGEFVSRIVELPLSSSQIFQPQVLQMRLAMILDSLKQEENEHIQLQKSSSSNLTNFKVIPSISKNDNLTNATNNDDDEVNQVEIESGALSQSNESNVSDKGTINEDGALVYVPPKCLPYQTLRDHLIHCGFVNSRVIKLKSNGFPCSPPNGFQGLWPQTAQALFGSFDRKRFFGNNIFTQMECAIEESTTLEIFFHNKCPNFQFSNITLRTTGTAAIDIIPEIQIKKNQRTINCQFIAHTKGTVEITGIEFEWRSSNRESYFDQKSLKYQRRKTTQHLLSRDDDIPRTKSSSKFKEYHVIKFVTIFPGSPLIFNVFDVCPKIDISIEGGKSNIFVNEIVPITIKIKNGPIKLKYLAMMALGNSNYVVLEPQNEELQGQRFLKALDSNEELVVRLAVCGKIVGNNSLHLIFPYWSFDPPCRYSSCNFDFIVHPSVEIPLFMQNETVAGQCPNDFTAFGFTSQLLNPRLFITKLEGRNCQMSLIHAISNGQPSFNYELPDYCLPFIEDKNDCIVFWYKSESSFVFHTLELTDIVVSVLIKEDNSSKGLYTVIIKNISKKKIQDVRISFVEIEEKISYIFSGPAIKNIGTLDIEEVYEYKVRIQLLFDEASPVIMISGENFANAHCIVIKS